MDWSSLFSTLAGGFLAMLGGYVATIVASKKDKEKVIMEQKLVAYSELIPHISSTFSRELQDDEVPDLDEFDNLLMICGKALLYCSEKLAGDIGKLINSAIEGKNITRKMKKLKLTVEDYDTKESEFLTLAEEFAKNKGEVIKLRSTIIDTMRDEVRF